MRRRRRVRRSAAMQRELQEDGAKYATREAVSQTFLRDTSAGRPM
jgi:hypothetical protein